MAINEGDFCPIPGVAARRSRLGIRLRHSVLAHGQRKTEATRVGKKEIHMTIHGEVALLQSVSCNSVDQSARDQLVLRIRTAISKKARVTMEARALMKDRARDGLGARNPDYDPTVLSVQPPAAPLKMS